MKCQTFYFILLPLSPENDFGKVMFPKVKVFLMKYQVLFSRKGNDHGIHLICVLCK